VYKEIILTTFKEEFAYKTEFVMSLIGSMINLFVLWFLWNAIFNAYGAATLKGFTLPMMITYISISTILGLYSRSMIEYMIEEDVKTGFLSVMLTRPISYPLYYLFREIGKIIFFLMTRGLIIILISVLIFNIYSPSNPIFFLSMILGFFINFFMVFLTGLWSFWSSGSIWGIRYTRIVVSEILSGAIIPLYLFPNWLSQISYALPFQAIYSIPLLIYIGKITNLEIFNSLLTQIFWIIFLGILCLVGWKIAKKKTTSQGG
jgi:ABC-2 type transport system permease protein